MDRMENDNKAVIMVQENENPRGVNDIDGL